MKEPVFEAEHVTKRFGDVTALWNVSLRLAGPSIIGLIGPNASGKTTLLRHVVGLQLPSEGEARTFGVTTRCLGHDLLARIGVVPQQPSFLAWMSVGQQLDYLSRFYARWDRRRQLDLLALVDLRPDTRIRGLSAGSVQKLAIVAALCHHPQLILLDEPVSNLDPLVRERFLKGLLDIAQEDGATVVISSHVLHDIERSVDWIVCLDAGSVVADAALDTLKERYAEWRVARRSSPLPSAFPEPFIVRQSPVGSDGARLLVRTEDADLGAFIRAHGVDVSVAPLNLQGLFPALVAERRP